MILPEGKNKKYVNVISGLYILYVILNPFLKLDKNFFISDIKSAIVGTTSGSYVSQEKIAKNYIIQIENNLKDKIESLGYKVEYIQFYITSDYSDIRKIEVKMMYGENFDKEKIEKVVLENFSVDKSSIMISWGEWSWIDWKNKKSF